MSLGDHLGAHQDARTAPARSAAGSRHGLPRARALSESSRKTGSGATASSSRVARRSVPAPWRARATEPHAGQDSGTGSPWPQWWQRRRSRALVEDQRDVAVRALPGAPAGSAAEKRRPAAPVEQDDRLGARLANLGQRLPDARVERAGNGSAPPASADLLAAVHHLDLRQVAPVGAARQLEAVAAPASSRAAAWRCRREARLRLRPPAAGRPRGRRSADRPPACRRRRAPRRSPPGPGRAPGRRPPSAARRRSAPRRPAGAPTRRGARPRPAREWSSATRSPKRDANRDIACGVSPISGTSTIAPLSRSKRRLGGRQVDLGLARARDPVQEVLAGRGAVDRGDDRVERRSLLGRQPRSRSTGRRRRRPSAAGSCAALRSLTRPRASRRLSASPVGPAIRLRAPRPRARRRPPRRRASRSAARWREPRRLPSPSAARPASVAAASVSSLGPVPRPPRPTLGGSTSSSPRAGVEQYSRATQRPEPDELRRRPGGQGLDWLREPLRRQLARLGHLDHHADHPPAAERHQEDAADTHLAEPLGQR